MNHARRLRILGLGAALGTALSAAACSASDPPPAPSPIAPADVEAGAPWYSTSLDRDTSYLPMGGSAYAPSELAWTTPAGDALRVDAYVPRASNAPVVVFLPGAFVKKERYFWLGNVLASHGAAVFIVQPPDAFARSTYSTATLTELARQVADAASPLAGRLDLSRVVLAGHSIGAFVHARLADVTSCPPGFCPKGDELPAGVRGMLLFGFHNENPDVAEAGGPMRAIDVPWLIVNGGEDGLTTPAKGKATFARLIDRPATLVTVRGMNHYQFTDYVDPTADKELARDLAPTIPNRDARATAAEYAVRFVKRVLLGDATIAEDLDAKADARVVATAKGARMATPANGERAAFRAKLVGRAGLDGAEANTDVVAVREYAGATYLLVRNDSAGATVWRIAGGVLEPVPFPGGVAHGVYGNFRLNALLGAMEVYRGKLWVGFSSGIQGTKRGSTGAELWTFDGTTWEPVVSNRRDIDAAVVVSAVSGCEAGDGDPTARLTIRGAAFTPGEWRGAVVDDVDTTTGEPVILDVIDNTADTLVVQDNASAGTTAATTCDGTPVGASLKLRRGADENGFGQPWNKAITAMAVYGDKLYVATGLNYAAGGELYSTADGDRFEPAIPRGFFGKHADGGPISTSLTALHVSSVDGTPKLYVAANGTSNFGARLAVVGTDGKPLFLVDDGGAAKAGFGRALNQIASMVTFGGRLWVGSFDFAGLEILSSAKPSDGAWRVDVGTGGAQPRAWGDPSQIVANLSVARNELWVGDTAVIATRGALDETSASALRTRDGKTWGLATAHAFGLNAVGVSKVFEQSGTLYAVAARGALASRESFGPLRIYALREETTSP